MEDAKDRPASNRALSSAQQKRDTQRARVLRSVVDELERARGPQAAKLFRDGQDHGLFPSGNGLPRWLIKTIGKEATGKLVNAFAQFPCFYCEDGLEPCEVCRGRGTIAGSMICEACAGLGIAPCGFCDGSGLVTKNVVPPGLQLVVLAERVDRACGRIEMLLQEPVPRNVSADPVKAAKRCAKQLLDVNRQLGVFENAVVASKGLARTRPSSKEKLARIIGLCCRTTVEAHKRIRELAEHMGLCAKLQAETADADAAVRKRAEKGSAFYESLAGSRTFAGTPLEHPYLQRTLARLSRKQPTGSRAGGQTRSTRRR